MDKPEFLVELGPVATDEAFAIGMAKLLEREGRTIAAAELRRLHAERAAADGVINDLVAKVRELQKENTSLSAALASSCDEQRHELWESGGIAGCERARVAERQRDALLEACRFYASMMGRRKSDGEPFYMTPLDFDCGDRARAAIKAVEEGK